MWVFHNDYYLKLRPDPRRQLLVVSLIPSLSRVLILGLKTFRYGSYKPVIVLPDFRGEVAQEDLSTSSKTKRKSNSMRISIPSIRLRR